MTATPNKFHIAPGLIWRLLDDNVVIVSPGVGKVRVLNGMATIIWQLMGENKNQAEIEAYLATHYEASIEQVREDLQDFLADLKDRGLIVD